MIPAVDILIIEPGLADRHYWRDLWRYRGALLRAGLARHLGALQADLIGGAWALFQPFLTMVIFTVVFGHLAKLPTRATPPIAGFRRAVALVTLLRPLPGAAGSMIGNANLISKVYFPRLIVPTATVGGPDRLPPEPHDSGLGDDLVPLLPGWQSSLPLFVPMALLASLGPGLWITALNVKYRDFR